MKNIFALSFITLFMIYGCSTRPVTPESEPSSTISPTETSTQTSIPSQVTTRTLETQIITTKTPTREIEPITTPEQSGYPIAGIEAKKTGDIELIASAGMSWTRQNALQWHLVERKKGERTWSVLENLDGELIEASELGLNTILIVRGTPEWAQKIPGSFCGPVKEEELFSWGEFLFDAVRRYSQPPYNVKYWELGNEPDVPAFSSGPDQQWGCWGDDSDTFFGGGYYADMLEVVYPRIKAADPTAQVLIGGLLLDCDPSEPPEIPPDSGQYKDCKPATFLEGILLSGGGEYFDGIAFHAYDYYDDAEGQYANINWHSSWDTSGPVLVAKTRYLSLLLEKYGHTDKYLMNTEGALLCGRDGNESYCMTDVFNQTKTNYLVQSYTVARALDLRANIWFYLHGWRGSGLIDKDGNPLPAFDALVFNSMILKDVQFQSEILDFSGISGYSFYNQESILWVLWTRDEDTVGIHLGEVPDRIYDVIGRDILPNRDIPIGYSPTYIFWDINQ